MSAADLRLAGSERLLWSGAPPSGVMFRSSDLFLIPFSLFWCGFVIRWETLALRNDRGTFSIVWGIPFVVVGLYLVAGRFIHDAWNRSRTTYTVTSERIVILCGDEEKSLPLKTLSEYSLKTRSDGSGTIQFGTPPPYGWRTRNSSWPPGTPQVPSFEGVPDARTLYELIRRAQKEASGT